MDYIESNAILTEFKRGGRKVPFTDRDMKAHINSEIKKIIKHGQKSFSIALLTINKREVILPKEFYVITQALYLPEGNYFGNKEIEKQLEEKGIEFDKCLCKKPDPIQDPYDPQYKLKYDFKNFACDNHCILDLLFRPNFLAYTDIQVVSMNQDRRIKKNNTAYVMRPRMNNFYNLQYHINGCFNINADSSITYDIVDNNFMNVNMDKGYVLLSYLANKIDKEGYLLIPNDPFVQDALIMSLNTKIAEHSMLRNMGNNYHRSIWRDYLSLLPMKMLSAERQMKKISKDKLDLILETKWNNPLVYDSPLNDYKPPENLYPEY